MHPVQRRKVVFLSILFLCIGSAAVGPKPASVAVQSNSTQFSIKQRNPVVNEGNRIVLTATDAGGNPVDGARWSSGSPDIAAVDAATGEVRGVEQGFATVTATLNGESSSVFVVVARVTRGKGEKVPGDLKADRNGRLFLSNPAQNVIMTMMQTLSAPVEVYAGMKGARGLRNGEAGQSLFAGPTAIGVDNGVRGGVYVTDTLNHSVRKIGFDRRVETMLGGGSPGVTAFDVEGKASFEQIRLNAPRGVASDTGGNLFLADTDNHAIYYADFGKREVLLLAGAPGESGKADGAGREARFSRPAGLAVDSTGRVVAVADADNNRVRLLELNKTGSGELTCRVVTVGVASSARGSDAATRSGDREDDELAFNRPSSVGFDSAGNLNVVDGTGAYVVIQPIGQHPQIVPLAQPGSFKQAASVTVNGTAAFVLDAEADDPTGPINQVTVGAPEITGLSLETVQTKGGEQLVVTGKNFAPESLVVLGDAQVTDYVVESATRISLTTPKQVTHGSRSVTVQTRGGTAQRKLTVIPTPLAELNAGDITTVAGGVPDAGDGGQAKDAAMTAVSLAVNAGGDVIFADQYNHRVRRIDTDSGIVTALAGSGAEGTGGDDGPALGARLDEPLDFVFDASGDMFIADSKNRSVRRVEAVSGRISTIAGGRIISPFFTVTSVAVDQAGNVYVADATRVHRIQAGTKEIKPFAGTGKPGFSGDGGPALEAELNELTGITLDKVGNLYITDRRNNRIRRVDAATGIITTVAGNGSVGTFTGEGGPATQARLDTLWGKVAFDGNGNFYFVAGENDSSRVLEVKASDGTIKTIARSPVASNPRAVALDGFGNLFVATKYGLTITKVNVETGEGASVAGVLEYSISGVGEPGTNAYMFPLGVTLDSAGNVFISNFRRHKINRIDAQTQILTDFAGNGSNGFGGDGGPADKAGTSPYDLTFDPSGNLLLADFGRIRRIDAKTAIITTIAGGRKLRFGGDGKPAIKAGMFATGIAVDGAGSLYILDHSRVRRVDAKTGIITTIAGTGSINYSGDGGPATKAEIGLPSGMAVDGNGNVYVSDMRNHRIRRIDAKTGIISTVAGNGQTDGSGDGGPATQAAIGSPKGIAIDGDGNLFIADFLNNRIRRVGAGTGIITTVAGTGERESFGDGGQALKAGIVDPINLAFNRSGDLYVVAPPFIRVVKGIGQGR